MKKDYDIGNAFEAIENELIASMIRNMDRHRAEETVQGIEWTQWQAEQLKALERYKLESRKKYRKQFTSIHGKISDTIQTARAAGNMEQEISILEAIQNGFQGTNSIGRGLAGEFFRLNDRKLNALLEATTKDMQKAETAILRMANDQYRKIIFNAQVYANTGAGTYEKAVDMATKDFLSKGLNCVEYANGARHTLADYADMALRTAGKRAYLTGEGEKRKEWGISTVIMNKRGNPCPKCLPYVGKVMIDDVWSGGQTEGAAYPLMSHAIRRGLYHPRCRDSHTTYFPGISTADDTWTKEELDAIGEYNKQDAKQQYADRQAKKFGRLAKYSLDAENRENYKQKKERWENQAESKEIKIFGKEVKLIPDRTITQPSYSSFKEAQSLKEAREYAFANLGVVINNAEEIPLDIINRINKQYTELLKENPHMKGFIQDFDFTDCLEDRAFAARQLRHESDGRISRKILFNQKEYGDIDALKMQYASSVKSGHFPKGTTVDDIISHEFGHALADDMAFRISHTDINGKFSKDEWLNAKLLGSAFSKFKIEDVAKKLKISPKQLQKNISGYAAGDYSEAFAEAFSSTKGSKPSKEALAVMKEYDRIKKLYIKGVK